MYFTRVIKLCNEPTYVHSHWCIHLALLPPVACTNQRCFCAGAAAAVLRLVHTLCIVANGGVHQPKESFAAAAADFADWLARCAYLAQFRVLLFTFEGSYSSLTRVDPLERSYIGKSLL